jgi:KDO2-lipid IV(A) lauroyltransferase
MPPWAGYGLGQAVSRVLAWRKPEIFGVVRANLRRVVGPTVGEDELDDMARRVFAHAGQCYYDFYHSLDRPRHVYRDLVHISESFIEQVKSTMADGCGVLVLGLHMSNFDLGMLSLCAHGLEMQALSLANPEAGFRLQNRLRAHDGLDVTPISAESLRAGIRRLKRGGLVMTGIDRPVPEDDALIPFFGEPAYLPLGPARLAVMTNAQAYVGGCHYHPDTGYALRFTGPIDMPHSGDRRQDSLLGARRLAAVSEEYVRAHPEQWLMFHSVWPDPPTL